MELITQKEALDKGLSTYFTGKPCKKGHITIRAVVNGTCYGCIYERNAIYKVKNSDKIKKKKAEWHQLTKDKRQQYGKEYRARNKERLRIKRHEYLERRRANYLRHKLEVRYGLTKEQHEKLVVVSNGQCQICKGRELKQNTIGVYNNLSVDHDHQTGKVRGLLCNRCNTALGFFADDVNLLEAAVSYLKLTS